jgi:hypothetical protein
MRGLPVLASALVIVSGCGAGSGSKSPRLSQRQRDSAIGASRIPGAQGVGRALQASDSGAARRAVEDSLAREP